MSFGAAQQLKQQEKALQAIFEELRTLNSRVDALVDELDATMRKPNSQPAKRRTKSGTG